MIPESRRAVPAKRRLVWACLALVLVTTLPACSAQEPTAAPEPPSREASLPASGTTVARVESREASEALVTYLDGWRRDFNLAAVGSETGTGPLDAATAVPMDQTSTVTLSEYAVEPLGRDSDRAADYRVTFSFYSGNPLSGMYTESLESVSTYGLTWDAEAGAWVIKLTSSAPDSDPRPTTPPPSH
jgi:hypothetical protein